MFSSNQWRFRQSVWAFAAISVCLLLFFIGHRVASALPAQELNKVLDRDESPTPTGSVRVESQLVISLILDGSCHVGRVNCISVTDPMGNYSLLRQAHVCDEIRLRKSARRELDFTIETADRTRHEMLQRMWGASSAQKRTKADDWFREQEKNTKDLLAKLLSANQKKRLEEIRQRTILRLNGWPEYIRRSHKAGLIDWELSDAEVANLATAASDLKEEAISAAKQLHSDLLGELFDELDEGQVKSIREFAFKLTESTGALDLFREQLKIEKITDDLGAYENAGSAESLFKRIRRPVFFTLGEDGGLERFRVGSPNNFMVPLRSDQIEWYADLLDSLYVGNLGREIGINDSQSERIFELMQDVSSFRDWAGQFLEKSENPLIDSENLLDMQNAVQSKIEPALGELLSKDQLKALEVYVDFADLAKFGLLPNLLEGRIGKELGVSQAQKLGLKKFANSARDRIDKLSRELEEKCWNEMFSRLEPSHRADVLRLLGKQPVKLNSSFHLLIESLSRLENRNANAQ
jgi:hypothetical protein